MTMRLVPAAVLAAALLTGCSGEPPEPAGTNVLTGTVKMNGEPVDFVMLVVTGSDGKSASGPSLPGGRYRIENPPTGALRFKFAAAPPGAGGPTAAPKSAIAPRYFTDRNELAVEYPGGAKTFDVELKP